MKRMLVLSAVLLLAAPAHATKTYQATGAVVDVTPNIIVIDKGKEGKWEIARDASTKGGAEVKKGDKVTIEYKMLATSIEVKGGKAKGGEKGKGEAKGKDKK